LVWTGRRREPFNCVKNRDTLARGYGYEKYVLPE
jgi:hypothetical protein